MQELTVRGVGVSLSAVFVAVCLAACGSSAGAGSPNAAGSLAPAASEEAQDVPLVSDPVDVKKCGSTYPKSSGIDALIAHGPASSAVVCTYPYADYVSATPADPRKVYEFLESATTSERTDSCTLDGPPSRWVRFTYADGSRRNVGLSLPATCQSFDGRGDERRFLTRLATRYFESLIAADVPAA